MKIKAWIAACSLAVFLLVQPVVAGQSKENCKSYELSEGHDRATLAATSFTILNDGPDAVVIETENDQSLQVIEPTKHNEENAFLGDVKFTYFVSLAKANGKSKFTVCSLAGALEDATTAYNRGDYATALGLFRPLADHGDAFAQYSIGVLYTGGQGVAQDYAEAVKWYRLAADQGMANAQSNLGAMYTKGQGVAQDYAVAMKWYQKAADQGDAFAQYNVGVMYEKGQGVPSNFLHAYMWFDLASNSLLPSETKYRDQFTLRRDRVAKQMTPDQIAEAQRLANGWLSAHPKK